MLKGIDPLLGPELLATLRAMGHADEIAIVDANFPAAANAQRLIRAEGASAPRMIQAILSVLPLEQFEPTAAFRMAADDAPDEIQPVIGEFAKLLEGGGLRRADRRARPLRLLRADALGLRHRLHRRASLLGQPDPEEGRDPARDAQFLMRIDAHQHFWRLARGDYGWLTTEDFPGLYRDFGPSDLASLLDAASIERTVLVQAAPTAAETAYLLELAAATPFVAGVVGWTDLEASDAPGAIESTAANPKLLGLRPMLQDLDDDAWICGRPWRRRWTRCSAPASGSTPWSSRDICRI